ncbi:MAG: hypothetical protein KDK70_18485 [Myxococcales bacterium]|nr:hypothetical protein [Myxococcales bacterium]
MLRPRPGRLGARTTRGTALVVTGLLVLAPACDDHRAATDPEQLAERVGDVLPMDAPVMPTPLPTDRASMLRALAPLPSDALLVVYEIDGPGGIDGSLEVLARPGGYRRENWTIHVPLGAESARRLAGSIVQTPDGVWVEGSDPASLTPSPLGALADAALALDDEARRTVIEQLDLRRATLDLARRDDPTPPERILDRPCHSTRVATIEMCVWEATGLPLRYQSEGLRLRAVNIDDDASIGAHAFDLPAAARRTTPPGFDAPTALQQLAHGELAELTPYLHPGLRLPTAV